MTVEIDVEAALDGATDVVGVTAELLRRLADVSHARSSAVVRDAVRVVRDHVEEQFRGHVHDLRLPPDDRAEIVRVADLHGRQWTTARGVAEALDRLFGHRFWEAREGAHTLAPGDPVCCSRPDPSRLVGEPTVNPARLEEGIWSRLPHLRLAPAEVAHVDVTLTVTAPEAYAAIDGPATIAIGQTERVLEDFAIESIDGNEYFGVTPSVVDATVERLGALAVEVDADVVVFPELCVQPSAAGSLLSAMRTSESPPLVVVAGSHHRSVGAGRENVAPWWLAGDERAVLQTKHTPFVWEQNGVERTEAIEAPARPTLHLRSAGQWLAGVLICRDVIHEPLINLVRDLGVNLLCVPAFTPRVDPFLAEARVLAVRDQAFTVLANTPASTKVTAILSVPARENGQRVVGVDEHPEIADCDGLLVLRTRGGKQSSSNRGRIVSEWFPVEVEHDTG